MARLYRVEWNPNARRYAFRTASGGYGFLSEEKVRTIVDSDIDVTGARMGKLGSELKKAAQGFKDGRLDQSAYLEAVKEYRDGMAAQIKGCHIGQAAAAVGGLDNMGSVENGRVGGLLRVQYRYLENACAEFAADPDLVLSNGSAGVDKRGPMYAESSRFTFERFKDIADGENGMPYLISILERGAHHCEVKPGQAAHLSCPGQSVLGVLRYDDARRIAPGARICGPLCKCGTRRFKTREAALAALGVAI